MWGVAGVSSSNRWCGHRRCCHTATKFKTHEALEIPPRAAPRRAGYERPRRPPAPPRPGWPPGAPRRPKWPPAPPPRPAGAGGRPFLRAEPFFSGWRAESRRRRGRRPASGRPSGAGGRVGTPARGLLPGDSCQGTPAVGALQQELLYLNTRQRQCLSHDKRSGSTQGGGSLSATTSAVAAHRAEAVPQPRQAQWQHTGRR